MWIRPSRRRLCWPGASHSVVAKHHAVAARVEAPPCPPLASLEPVRALLAADRVIRGDASRAERHELKRRQVFREMASNRDVRSRSPTFKAAAVQTQVHLPRSERKS